MSNSAVKLDAEGFIEFQVDQAVISDFIHRQNGTLSTSIRELVMNFVDAGAPSGDIIIEQDRFEVIDAGVGFKSREIIDRYFRRFGTPHEEGDAKYGRYRIGRGQCMSLAKMCWHSNQFKMSTDVKSKGNGFFLKEDPTDFFAGCRVTGELYVSLNTHQLEQTVEEIKKYIRFMSEPVTVNGVMVSQAGAETAWDYETDNFCIKWEPLRERGIRLYSQGVYVKDIYQYGYGFNADIVTKKALKLNMARNEISDHDEIWLEIAKVLRQRSIEVSKMAAKSSRMDESVRCSTIENLLSGHINLSEAMEMNLFRDCRKRLVSVSQIMSSSVPVSVAKESGCRISDSLITQRIALVLHHEELRLWRVSSVYDLKQTLADLIDRDLNDKQAWHATRKLDSVSFVPFSFLAAGFDPRKELLKAKDLTARQRAGLAALAYISRLMARLLSEKASKKVKPRKVIAGLSETALAWTDGHIYIAFDLRFLEKLDEGVPGFVRVCSAMLHEYGHNESDLDSHEHDFEFYQNFHDSACLSSLLGTCVKSLFHQYSRQLIECNEKLPGTIESIFNDPISNELQTYTGRLGKRRLSTLAKLLLDSSAASYQVGTRVLECTVNQLALADERFRWNKPPYLLEKIESALASEAKKDGYQVPDIRDYRELSKQLYRQHLYDALVSWAKDKGHDTDVIAAMPDAFDRVKRSINYDDRKLYGGFEAVLKLICLDRNSELISFSSFRLVPIEIKGSASSIQSFANLSKKLTFKYGDAITADHLAKDGNLRVKTALHGIRAIIDGITDPDEQAHFVQTYLKDGLFDVLNDDEHQNGITF